MYRTLAVGFGILEFLLPHRIVAWGERLAFENPGEGRLRPWTIPIARLEGLLFVWLALSRRRPSPVLRWLLGGFGVFAFLAPRGVLEAGLGVAYENRDEIEVQSWVVPFTRALGVLYVVLALFVGRVDAPEDERREQSTSESQ